jgi:hypothetical protein
LKLLSIRIAAQRTGVLHRAAQPARRETLTMLLLDMHMNNVANASRYLIADRHINHSCGNAVISLAAVVRDRRIEIELVRTENHAVAGEATSKVEMPLPLAKLFVSALEKVIAMIVDPDVNPTKGAVICEVRGEAVGGALVVSATYTDLGIGVTATVTTPDHGTMTLPLPTAYSLVATRSALLELLLVATCVEGPLDEAVHRMSHEPAVDVTRKPNQVTGGTLALALVKWPMSPDLIA